MPETEQTLKTRAIAIGGHVARFFKRWQAPLRAIWIVAIIGFVVWKLYQIGLGDVMRSIPSNPLFYLLYWVGFLVLPVSERMVYSRIWSNAPRIPIRVFLRKRVLNNVVFGYSGDVWFYLWTRGRLGLPDRRLLAGLKDSSILSGAASAVSTAALGGVFALLGDSEVLNHAVGDRGIEIWAAIVIPVLLLPLALRFRHKILWVGQGTAATIFGVHFARIWIVQLLTILQWMVVLPMVPFETWLLFLTVQMLIQQLPVLPNLDLVFLAVGVGLTRSVGVDQAALAAMFVAVTLLRQLTNLSILVITSLARDDAPIGAESSAPPPDRPQP